MFVQVCILFPVPLWSAGVGEASPAAWRTVAHLRRASHTSGGQACGDTSALLVVAGAREVKIPRGVARSIAATDVCGPGSTRVSRVGSGVPPEPSVVNLQSVQTADI